jgi:predicted permease
MPNDPPRRRYKRFRGTDPQRDADEEIAFHLAMRVEEYERLGHGRARAEEEAMERFGNLADVRAELGELGRQRAARRRRSWRWEAIRQDARIAFRTLATQRAFSIVVALTLALGIGANTAVFSVAYGVLLRPLPYRDADALVRLWSKNATRGVEFLAVSPADYADWRAQNDVFSAMGAFRRQRTVTLLRGGEREALDVAAVTPDVFTVLGTTARMGRTILADDAQPDAPAIAVMSYDTWTTRFGGDSAIVGRTITLDDARFTVVGVMPPRFLVPGTPAEIWTPLSLAGASPDHSMHELRVLARLRPSVDLARAQAQLDLIAGRIAQAHPETNTGWTVNAVSLPEWIVGREFRRAVVVLVGVVVFVLLIACANAANLQLARATARRKEIALRAALGASRGRLAGQLLTESAVLGLVAGVGGLVLSYGGLALLRLVGTTAVPRLDEVRIDAPALAFTVVIALGSGLLFGLVPALQASRTDVGEVVKEGGRSAGHGGTGERIRSALVVAEVTLSLVLLIGAGLLMRSFLRLQTVDIGFDPRGVVVAPIPLPPPSPSDSTRLRTFTDALLEQLAATPGVIGAAAVSNAPFAGGNPGMLFARADQPVPPGGQPPDADYRVITPGYLQTLRIPLRRGRDIAATDQAGAPNVVLISETMARRYWPAGDALGARIRTGDLATGREHTIVGIVADVRYQSLEEPEIRPMVYFPASQRRGGGYAVVARAGDPSAVAGVLRRIVGSLDAQLPPPSVASMEDLLGTAMATRRFALVLFGTFAATALVLAAVGIYGVMSYLVRERTHELGIRVALGAPRSTLLASVVGRAIRLTVTGITLGLLGAWMLTRLLDRLLFGVSATDPMTYAGIAAVFTIVADVASLIPARRETMADPMEAFSR